ncbi:MAG: hypothetical protein IJL26_11565 [Clostridia bacterium]|nr:hypothetical protein [Clostridia bacterium]
MDKTLFIYVRIVTVLSTLFFALLCIPYICAVLSIPFETIPAIGNAVLLCAAVPAIVSGFAALICFAQELPFFDRLLSVLAPAVLTAEALTMFHFVWHTEISFQVLLGPACCVAGFACALIFAVDTVTALKKMKYEKEEESV